MAIPRASSATSDSALVTKAAIRAADRLGIINKLLARILGLSEASVSRMKRGGYLLETGQKPFELAVLFVRVYRSLDAVVGGDDAVARQWLRDYNPALKGQPSELIESVSGFANVIQYLDARRFVVERPPDGVLLKPAPLFAATKPGEVFASLPHRGAPKSLKDMDAGIAAEAKRRYTRD